jgi:hypothetical protein
MIALARQHRGTMRRILVWLPIELVEIELK